MLALADPRALQRRREQLLMRCAALRARLRHQAQALEAPLQRVDQGLQAARWLRAHPEWPLAAVGVWVVLRPRRAFRWALRGWWLWRGARRLLALIPQDGAPARWH